MIDAELALLELLEDGLGEFEETDSIVEVAEDRVVGVEDISLVSAVVLVVAGDATDRLLIEAIELDATIDCIEDKGPDDIDGDTTEANTEEAESPCDKLCRRSSALAALALISDPKRRVVNKKN